MKLWCNLKNVLELNLGMDNYIRIYEDVVDKSFCERMIEKFENDKSNWEVQNKSPMKFTQIKLINMPYWREEVNHLFSVFTSSIEQYISDCNIIKEMHPKRYGWEDIRIKRYLPNDVEKFGPHVDVTNYKNARRFLVCFIYLDDNNAGQTYFPQMEIASPCKRGSILIFPPLWPWLHAGGKPLEVSKYIVGSYLHYV